MFILLVLGVGAVVFFLWRARGRDASGRRFVPWNDRSSPLDILERRCARGEIDGEQYQRLREELR